jgi:hypothetical protein
VNRPLPAALYPEEMRLVLKLVKKLDSAARLAVEDDDGTRVAVSEIVITVDGAVPVRLVNHLGEFVIALAPSPAF